MHDTYVQFFCYLVVLPAVYFLGLFYWIVPSFSGTQYKVRFLGCAWEFFLFTFVGAHCQSITRSWCAD